MWYPFSEPVAPRGDRFPAPGNIYHVLIFGHRPIQPRCAHRGDRCVANQGIAFDAKSGTLGRKIDFTREPGFNRVTIGRGHIGSSVRAVSDRA